MTFKRFVHKSDHPNHIDLPYGEPSSVAAALLALASDQSELPSYCELYSSKAKQPASEDSWFTWGQIAQCVCEAVDALAKHDLPRGSHIASALPNSVHWIVLDLACQLLGHVHVAIDHRWPHVMIARLLQKSDAQIFIGRETTSTATHGVRRIEFAANPTDKAIASDDLQSLLERSQQISEQDAAQILFTSGTSSEPKGVVLSHRNLVSNALAKLDAAPQFETDRRLNILPFCHAYARTCELSTWILSRSKLAITSDWSSFLEAARRYRPTLVNLVPHLATKLLDNPEQQAAPENPTERLGGQVRLLQVGGAAINDADWHALANCGLAPLQGYGLTEAAPVVCSNRAGEQRPGTIGVAVKDVELKVDSDQQLWVRGPNVMLGYYGDQAATEARICDGWLATGDLVQEAGDGHYRIIGRTSSVIVLSTGFKVSPELIEARLMASQWIERIMIVGQSRSNLAAILWPAWTHLEPAFFYDSAPDRHSLKVETYLQAITEDFERRLSDLPAFMIPRRFVVADCDLQTESGLLNAKGGLRRGAVADHFAQEIKAAYSAQAVQYSAQ